MGRPPGSKNAGTYHEPSIQAVEVTSDEKDKIAEIFTCIQKDIIGAKDIMEATGLSYTTCTKMIREIKAVSDSLKISGYVHRIDYYLFLSRKFQIVNLQKEA